MGSKRHSWINSTYRYKEPKKMSLLSAFRVRSTRIGNRKYATPFNMSKFWNELQEFDINDWESINHGITYVGMA